MTKQEQFKIAITQLKELCKTVGANYYEMPFGMRELETGFKILRDEAIEEFNNDKKQKQCQNSLKH